jgi:magnesium transporter
MSISPIAHAPNIENTTRKPTNMRTISWGDLTWVDITDPAIESKDYLAQHYDFHPLDLDDCFSGMQLSKLDEYQKYIFVLLHFPLYQKARRKGTSLQWSAFIGDNFLVTLHSSDLSSISEIVHECDSSEETKRGYFNHGSGYLMYLILDRVVDAYFPVLDNISGELDGLEESVFDEEIEAAKGISILRQDILTQRRVMFPTRRLLAEMENKLKRFSKTDMSVYYGDLMDHMNKICETLDEFRDTVEVFKDADYVLSGYRANRLIRTIAVMLAIGLPCIIVFSIYLILPSSVHKGSLGTFIVLMIIMAAIVSVILFIMRKKRLI